MKTSQWIRPFFFTLLVVVVPLVGYYIYFVGSQETFVLERFHAHLANMATKTDARLQSAASVVRRNFGSANVLGLPIGPGGCGEVSATAARVTIERSETRQIRFTRDDDAENCRADADPAVLIGDVDPDDEFYDVVVLDGSNDVVFQQAPERGRIADKQLVIDSPGEGSSRSAVSDPLAVMRTTFHGRSFLMFTEPLATTSGAQVDTWKIVGLLPEADFNRLKYAVRPSGIVLVAIVIVGLLIAAPFLKIWYLGSFEPLTRFDICLQIGAGLVLVGMVTVSLLAWNTHNRLSERFDAMLYGNGSGETDGISEKLGSLIDEEFARAKETLAALEKPMIDAYGLRLQAGISSKNRDCPTLATRETTDSASPREPHRATLAGDLLKADQGQPDSSGTANGFRQIVMAYLMDQNGCQIVKWSSEATPPAPGPFADRPYFLRALPDERVSQKLDGPEPGYFREVIVSRTTGERRVAFSKPIGKPNRRDPAREKCREALRGETREPRPCVAVITAELRSLESVLPAGFGAVLVDADSNILLRSDGEDSTEINLADEVSEPVKLRAAVRLAVDTRTPTDEPLDATYHGMPHRFRVVPLHDGEWALVTYYNRNLATSTVLDAVAASILIWLLWISIISSVLIVGWVLDDLTDRSLRRWLATPLVVIAVVVAFVLLTFSVRFSDWFILPPSLWPAVMGIPLSLTTALLLARRNRGRINATFSRGLAVAATWLAVMLVAAYPMWEFYRFAEFEAVRALDGFEIKEFQLAEGRRNDAFGDWKHKVGLGGSSDWDKFDIWSEPVFKIEAEDQETTTTQYECDVDLVCFFLRRLPRYADGVSGVRAMYDVARVDRVIDRSSWSTEGHIVLLGDVHGAMGRFQRGALVIFGLLTAVGIWFLLVRTFGLRAENVVRVGSLPKTWSGEARYMLYGVPDSKKRDVCGGEKLGEQMLRIDLRDTPVDARVDIPAAKQAVALDHFDANLADINVVQQRVSMLEELLRQEKRVVVLFVSTDPLNFVTSAHTDEPARALISRFATVLSRFKLAYYGSARTEAGERLRGTFLGRLCRSWKRLFMVKKSDWRRALVRAECRHPSLRPIREELRDAPELDRLSKRQIIQQVQSRANAIYQHMWNQCTRVEKFTLMELAEGNPINPNNWDAARRLRLRGYVIADPFYRIASESLRQFAARAALQEDVRSWRAQSPGAWGQIKVPLLVLFIGALVFIAFTRPDLFNAFFAVMAAGAASFPFLVSALSTRLQRSAKSSGR